jgi:hypothetical protein
VTAHAKVTDVVEENNASRAGRIDRLAQQRAPGEMISKTSFRSVLQKSCGTSQK